MLFLTRVPCRRSVARALYSDADVYLFDDVLSALDARVGRKLFVGLKAFLAHKCVIFTNHHLQFAPYFDTIVVLNKEGVCVEMGTHEELMARRGALTNMLQDVSCS